MKKGQAQFIGWILLIGFTVAIGAFVGNWMLEQARETAGDFVEMTAKDVKCIDVSVSIICKNGQFEVVNTGYFTISELACYKGVEYERIDFNCKPRESKSFSIDLCTSIVPIVEIDGKLKGCSEKLIEVKCDE